MVGFAVVLVSLGDDVEDLVDDVEDLVDDVEDLTDDAEDLVDDVEDLMDEVEDLLEDVVDFLEVVDDLGTVLDGVLEVVIGLDEVLEVVGVLDVLGAETVDVPTTIGAPSWYTLILFGPPQNSDEFPLQTMLQLELKSGPGARAP